jgi:hypothetical protein
MGADVKVAVCKGRATNTLASTGVVCGPAYGYQHRPTDEAVAGAFASSPSIHAPDSRAGPGSVGARWASSRGLPGAVIAR